MKIHLILSNSGSFTALFSPIKCDCKAVALSGVECFPMDGAVAWEDGAAESFSSATKLDGTYKVDTNGGDVWRRYRRANRDGSRR